MKRWLLLLAGVVAAAVALLVGVVVRQQRPAARVLLPTGETVSVLGATCGTNHPAPNRYPLERRLPAPLRRLINGTLRYGPAPQDRQTIEPTLILWLAVQAGPATNPPPAPAWLYAGLEDAAGQRGGTENSLALFSAAVQGLQTVEFKVFPRRDREFWLVISQDLPGATYGSARPRLGRLAVRNPVPDTFPTWSPGPPPATQNAAGVEASLEGFLRGAGHSTTHKSLPKGGTRIEFSLAPTNTSPGAAILLRLRPTDGSTNRWGIGDLFTADAGGNLVKSSSSSYGRLGENDHRVYFRWEPVLWPGETWELRMIAKREADAAFAAEELVQFNNLVLPAIGGTNQYESRSVVLTAVGATQGSQVGLGLSEGSRLRLETIERRAPATGNSWSDGNSTRLRLTASGWTNGLYLDLVRATDERGHEVKSGSRGFGISQGTAEFTYSFQTVPADAKELNLVFAIHRGVPLTFRVDPSRPITNEWFGVQP